MRLRVIAVGTRMPAWVDAAFEDYRRRLRVPWRATLTELAPARRREAADAGARARAAEGRELLALLTPRDFVVALDEHGTQLATRELSQRLARHQGSGQDLAFLLGGPDGLAEEVLAGAQQRWALSRLTLPHGLARVVLIEQLYRAASLLAGHPYHRD